MIDLEEMLIDRISEKIVEKLIRGGEGSGNFGHEGRPGEVGGSAPSDENSFEIPINGRVSNKVLGDIEVQSDEELLDSFVNAGGNIDELDKNGELKAFYDPNSNKIFLSETLKGNKFEGIKFGLNNVDNSIRGRFLHEYGHHIWYNGLSNSEHQNWKKVYNSAKPDYWRVQISWKASRGAGEAFSELYTAYIRGGNVGSRLEACKDASKIFHEMMSEPTKMKGGEGSGNFGHGGRPGEVGGSGEGRLDTEMDDASKERLLKALQFIDDNDPTMKDVIIYTFESSRCYGLAKGNRIYIDKSTIKKANSIFVAGVIKHESVHTKQDYRKMTSMQREYDARAKTGVWAMRKSIGASAADKYEYNRIYELNSVMPRSH